MKLFAVALLLILPVSALAAPKKHTFDADLDRVFDAAVKSAQSNWTVKFADRKTHTISFSTGVSATSNGMDCSVSIAQAAPGKSEVTLQTRKKAQLYAWSAGDRIADKFFKGIESELGSMADTPAQ